MFVASRKIHKLAKEKEMKEEKEQQDTSEEETALSKADNKLFALFEDYKPADAFSLIFYEIFFVRRYLLIYSLVVAPNGVRIACFSHIHTTLFMVCYIARFMPYRERGRNIQEFWNEVTILVSIYCMTGFTDFFNSDEGRFDTDRECEIAGSNGVFTVRNEQCPMDYLQSTKHT